MVQSVDDILSQLSLEEKAYLTSGKSFWEIRGVDRLGLQKILMTDGPHGLRKPMNYQESTGNDTAVEAICFPTASALACSFNTGLLYEMGEYLGEECQAEEVRVLLGPGTNIKRTPLCGRNFEYFSEDPYLAGVLATSLIEGLQSKGVGASLKHYVANNQEHRRQSINAIIDERTLREIYLAAFEMPVKQAKPWTIMGSYNRLNGEYVCQNSYFLDDILRKQWGFRGLIMSDWGAVDQHAKAVAAGMDLEMPTSGHVGPRKLIKAVKKGHVAEESLDNAARHVIQLLQTAHHHKVNTPPYDKEAHHEKAREIASESIVLLQNTGEVLPLTLEKYKTIALIGDFAKSPRFQGGGSSHINPYKVDNVLDMFTQHADKFSIQYARGYDQNIDQTDEILVEKAKEIATKCDVSILFVGLPDRYETEGVDRTHLNLPLNHLELIDVISKVCENIIVVISAGSVVKMPFVDQVKGIVMSWLVGQAGAGAIVDILLGNTNPSGKLAESFIQEEHDDPSHGNYPGEDEVVYQEGIFVGYRYHDYYNKQVQFEFGFGLSYTQFEYSNLVVSKEKISEIDELQVEVDITNTGSVPGKEVVQLYIGELSPVVDRPPKELKGFVKMELEPGETKNALFNLDKRSFAYFNTNLADWHVNTGKFEIMIGKSSRNIILRKTVHVTGTSLDHVHTKDPVYVKRTDLPTTDKITRNTPMIRLKNHTIGSRIYNMMAKRAMDEFFELDSEEPQGEINSEVFDLDAMISFINNTPLRNLVNFTAGEAISDRKLSLLIFLLNITRPKTILGRIIGVVLKPVPTIDKL